MFLASTALEQFWNKDNELLFLGRWCIRKLDTNELQRLRYKILPNPWNDRQRLYDAIGYLDRLSETALVHLSEYLDQIHGVRFGARYWRVLVSPWLIQYLHVFFDRYTILNDALTKFPQLETITLDSESYYHPKDTDGFFMASGDDLCNLQLFSSILRAMGHNFPCQKPEARSQKPEDANSKVHAKSWNKPFWLLASGFWLHHLLLLESAVTRSLAKHDAVAMYSMYWKRPEQWKLVVQSGFRFFPLTLEAPAPTASKATLNAKARERIASIPAANEFERILWPQFAADLPAIYFESYQQTRERVLSSNPRFPEALLSDSAWFFDESFKFFAAESSRNGKRLLAAQHGGGYGVSRYIPAELHETRSADAYFVWGWADSRPRRRNLPSPRMGKKRPRLKNPSSIVLISTSNPVYLVRFQSTPLGDQWAEYFEWQLRFVDKLSLSNRRAFVYRPYPIDYGFDITTRLQTRYPEIRIHRGSLNAALREARLVVIDHCGTPLLETLAANIPTIAYWDPNRWEMRDDAAPYIQRLVECGILWPSPEDAARAVERVYDNVESWWNAKAVQDARSTFTMRFALQSQNWAQEWKTALFPS